VAGGRDGAELFVVGDLIGVQQARDILRQGDGQVLRDGTIASALEPELREAGRMFAQRVPEALRAKRDFLAEELMRRANKLLGGC